MTSGVASHICQGTTPPFLFHKNTSPCTGEAKYHFTDDFLFHKAVFDLDSVELFKKWLGGKIKEEGR